MRPGEVYPLWGRVNEADALVRKYHYSHKLPANIQGVLTWHLPGGLLGDTGPAIAACVFNIPAAKWREPVWELGRLVRWEDDAPPLTALIASACKAAARRIDLLVSYADSTQGHHGGIYQAASWHYDGQRSAVEIGVIVGGVPLHGRNANHLYKTRSRRKLAAMGIESEPLMDAGKHLYWRALTRDGEAKARRLELKMLRYPKPDEAIAARNL